MEVILRHKGKEPWSGIMGKYKSCHSYLGPYLTRTGSLYTGLTKEDEKRLEEAIGYPDGHLSKTSEFWNNFAVKVGEKELILDTSVPLDELKYLFLKNYKRVACGVNDIKPGTNFVLIDMESEAIQQNTINKRRREAVKEFDKMSIDEMRKALRLYGNKVENISNELIEAKLYDEVEKDPDKFFAKWVNNKTKETEFVIETAIAKNIMRVNRNIYYYGTEVVGHSMADTIAYLEEKKNQDLKLTILEEIKSKA